MYQEKNLGQIRCDQRESVEGLCQERSWKSVPGEELEFCANRGAGNLCQEKSWNSVPTEELGFCANIRTGNLCQERNLFF